MAEIPYDQRLARLLVRHLGRFPVTPNQLTTLTLLMALLGAGLLAEGENAFVYCGAGLFVLARFMDHFDGELARMKNAASKLGYYYGYITGALSYAALFLGVGVGLRHGMIGLWSLALGTLGASAAVISMLVNLGIDKAEALVEGEAIGYPALGGFELEDGIYLIAPITWLGQLEPLFIAASLGAAIYTLWTLATLRRVKCRAASNAAQVVDPPPPE